MIEIIKPIAPSPIRLCPALVSQIRMEGHLGKDAIPNDNPK
jgi:hypothetical protein